MLSVLPLMCGTSLTFLHKQSRQKCAKMLGNNEMHDLEKKKSTEIKNKLNILCTTVKETWNGKIFKLALWFNPAGG